jgi:hypothetical protein
MTPSPYPDSEGLQVAEFQKPPSNAPEHVPSEKECIRMSEYTKEEYSLQEGSIRELTLERASSNLSELSIKERRICGMRRRPFWILLGVACFVVTTAVLAGVIGALTIKLSARNR